MFTKHGKIYKCIAAILVVTFLICLAPSKLFSAKAGSSKVYVISSVSVSGDSINGGDFKVDGGVYAKDNKIVFDETSSKTAQLLAKTRINNLKEYGVKDLFSAEMTFEFGKLASGGKVAFAFGLKKSGSVLGSTGSGAIIFSYDDDRNCIAIEANEYTDENLPTVIAAKSAYSMLSFHSEITLTVDVDVNGKVYAAISCEEANVGKIDIIKGKKLTIDPEGYVAFISESAGKENDKKNVFTISDVSVTAYAYDLVETVDHYIETFDKNSYNANMFYSETTGSGISPSKIVVEDGKLVFSNVGQGYFTTK